MAEALTLQFEDKALILGRLATPSLSEPRLLHAGCTGLTWKRHRFQAPRQEQVARTHKLSTFSTPETPWVQYGTSMPQAAARKRTGFENISTT